ncbi:hypothetical protein V4M49_03200 [Levilactobacillus brevis]
MNLVSLIDKADFWKGTGKMKSTWNLVGMALWVLVLVTLIWMVHDMRVRRIRLIVKEHHSFSWRNLAISTIELVVWLLFLGG